MVLVISSEVYVAETVNEILALLDNTKDEFAVQYTSGITIYR